MFSLFLKRIYFIKLRLWFRFGIVPRSILMTLSLLKREFDGTSVQMFLILYDLYVACVQRSWRLSDQICAHCRKTNHERLSYKVGVEVLGQLKMVDILCLITISSKWLHCMKSTFARES